MRGISFTVLAISMPVLAALAGCGDRTGDVDATSTAAATQSATAPAAQPPDADGTPKTFTYTGKARIPVRLTMHESEHGGQQTPFFGGYRPTVIFGEGDSAIEVVCAVDTRYLEKFIPGGAHAVDLRCTRSVSLRTDALDFVVRDGGREVGAGTVTP